jgi:dolichol-phosphate mannosyltransferase
MTSRITRIARFSAVGASGVALNMGVLILLTQGLGIHYAISSLFAIELSILSNFALNNAWTWSDRRNGTLGQRLAKYHLVAGGTAISANWGLLILLTRFCGIEYRISNLIGIAAGLVLNFVLNHLWTFNGKPAGARSLPPPPGRERLKQRWMAAGFSPRWNVTVAILLAMAMGLRLAAMIGMPLTPEEAYYWMYSQHPSLSYFDHPPMVAWLIWFGTRLFGNTEFGVRAGPALTMLAASGVMYGFSRMWFGREAAVAAAALLQILPVYFGAGLIATMDPPLVLFWLVCLAGVSVAVRRDQTWGWYLAGFGLGGGMLCKYTAIFLAVGALLAVAGYPPWRRHLRAAHPYLATLLALAMFTPVLVWNERHGWASFRFQFVNRFAGGKIGVANPASFAWMQLVVATPLLLLGAGWLYARILRNRRRLLTPRWWMLLCFSLPLLLVMSYKSLRYHIHLSWTMQAYLAVFPAVAQTGLALGCCARKTWAGVIWRPAALATVAGCLALNVLALVYLLALQPRMGLVAAMRPWPQLAAAVETADARLKAETGREPLVIGADAYRLAGELAFYRAPLERNVRVCDFTSSQWILGGEGLGYAYWTKREEWIGRDCIVVNDQADIGRFAPRFEKFEFVDECHLPGKTYYIGIGRRLRQ